MKTFLIALLVGALGVWAGQTLQKHIYKEEVDAWYGKGETLLVFSDGANAMLIKDWIYFETWDSKIYPITHIGRFCTKVNWQPHNVSLPERSVR